MLYEIKTFGRSICIVRDELVANGRAEPHHIIPQSGWVSIHLNQESDLDRAIELLRFSFEIAVKRNAGYQILLIGF
jgi:hypothetical protein